jgi:hypothetical protein
MSNYKDIASSICGALIVLAGAFATAAQIWPAEFPKWVTIAAFIVGTSAAGWAAKLIGKNPDGSVKSPEQVATQNEQSNPPK